MLLPLSLSVASLTGLGFLLFLLLGLLQPTATQQAGTNRTQTQKASSPDWCCFHFHQPPSPPSFPPPPTPHHPPTSPLPTPCPLLPARPPVVVAVVAVAVTPGRKFTIYVRSRLHLETWMAVIMRHVRRREAPVVNRRACTIEGKCAHVMVTPC